MPNKHAKGTPVRLPLFLYEACKAISGEQPGGSHSVIHHVRQMALQGREYLQAHCIAEKTNEQVNANRDYAAPRLMGFDSQVESQLQSEARQKGFSYARYVSLLVATGLEQHGNAHRRQAKNNSVFVNAQPSQPDNRNGVEYVNHRSLDDLPAEVMAVYTPLIEELDALFQWLQAPLSTTQQPLRYVPIVWISGPSGCGKTTLASALTKLRDDVLYIDASMAASRSSSRPQRTSLDNIRQSAKYLVVDECHTQGLTNPQTLVNLVQAYREQRTSILLLSQSVSKQLFEALSEAGITIILSAFESRGQLPLMARSNNHERLTVAR